jgi:hypothetical protein
MPFDPDIIKSIIDAAADLRKAVAEISGAVASIPAAVRAAAGAAAPSSDPSGTLELNQERIVGMLTALREDASLIFQYQQLVRGELSAIGDRLRKLEGDSTALMYDHRNMRA